MSGTINVLNTAGTIVGSGPFNRRITIQQLVHTGQKDGIGGENKDYQDLITTWAHIEPYMRPSSAAAMEAFRDDQMYATRYILILIRYRPTLNIAPGMQVLYGVQKYRIRQVDVPAEARTTITLLCEELQAQGSLH
jgi:SPP1 family predicted phage head-tail adaptor